MNRPLRLLAALASLLGASAGGVPETDSQSWSEVDAITKISPRTEAIAFGTTRMRQDLPDPTLPFAEATWTASRSRVLRAGASSRLRGPKNPTAS